MKILIGTTNPAKAKVFAKQLADYEVELLTLTDLGIQKHPDEDGKDPMENAMIKAAYYGRFHDPVITEDSALYIKELPMDDPRQPGLFVRRAPDGHEMTDEEMTEHYAALARSLGGRVTAYWLDGYAVCKDGKLWTTARSSAASMPSIWWTSPTLPAMTAGPSTASPWT